MSGPGYDEALAWLFSRTRGGGRRTPTRAARLLERLELTPPALTVGVVGTNGKGSVTNMIATGLAAAGHRTGRFLSPHVESFRERVAVSGEPVSEAAVEAFVAQVRALPPADAGDPELGPAFFEWTLALALSEFRRQAADAAVLEAGVGGGSDATRAVEPLSLVVITNVDRDHTETLGHDLGDIARDKVGAMRPGVPVVSGVTQPELRAIVAAEAERLAAPLFQDDPAGAEAIFALPPSVAAALGSAPTTRASNARLAAAALRLLGADEDAVEAGLRAPPLPARGERFLLPAPGGAEVEVLLDGAHDPVAARRLVGEVGARPYVLLFGALARKQGAAVLNELAPGASAVLLTEASPGEGTVPWQPGATFVPDPAAALTAALALAAEPAPDAGAAGAGAADAGVARPLVLVAGSLYLAGHVRPLLRERGVRLPAPWEQGAGAGPNG
ncbi:MAG: bifunctional folylpolyglutamate synthase/dihydrofolate synthase [Deinococcales bacterium]|nr:bifunctional folylpolyglutamate synthase/dihydrofolate synthase [Deinococcales bacterium]